MARIPEKKVDPIGLQMLLDTLRHQHAFQIGTQEYLNAQHLGTLISGSGTALEAKFKSMLGPLVCTTPAEVQTFERCYAQFLPQLFPIDKIEEAPPRPANEADPSEKPPASVEFVDLAESLNTSRRIARWRVGGLGIITAILVWLFWPTPDKLEYGSLIITSVPDSAQVFLDGVLLPVLTPVQLDTLQPGNYVIRVTAPGMQARADSIQVTTGQTASFNVFLDSTVTTTSPPPLPPPFTDTIAETWPDTVHRQVTFGYSGDAMAWGHPGRDIFVRDLNAGQQQTLGAFKAPDQWLNLHHTHVPDYNVFVSDLVLKGHDGIVTSVAYSPAGDRIVSGSTDNSIKIWNALSGELINTLNGHDGSVWSVAFSPAGDRIVSGSTDNSIKIWNALSGELINTLNGHDGSVYSIAYSPAGDRIVSGSADNSIKIWNALSGELINTLNRHTNSVRSIAYSPAGDRIVSGSFDNSIKIWNAQSGELINTLNGHTNSVYSIAYSPAGDRIVSGSADNSIKIWNALSGELINTLNGHDGSVRSIAYSPAGDRIVSGSLDNSIKIWNALSGELINTLNGHDGSVWSIAYSPAGDRIVSGSVDNSIKIWNALSGELINTLNGHDDSVLSVAYSPAGDRIVSGSTDNSIKIWNALSGELINTLNGHTNSVYSIAYSPAGDRIVSGSADNSIKIWNALSGELINTLNGHTNSVRSIAYSPAGDRIVSGSLDNSIKIWNALSGELINTLNGHDGSVWSIAYSPAGDRIVSGSTDNSIKIWNALSGELINTLNGHDDSVLSVAYSPAGDRIVSGSTDNSIKIWNALSGELINTLNGHTNSVYSIAYSPAGDRIVSGSFDNSIKIWNALSGELINTLNGHDGSVWSVAYSPAGDRIVSGSTDISIKIWWSIASLPPKQLALLSTSDRMPGSLLEAYRDSQAVTIRGIRNGVLYDSLLHASGVEHLAFTPSGNLYWAQEKGTINFKASASPEDSARAQLPHAITGLSTYHNETHAVLFSADSLLRVIVRDSSGLNVVDSLKLEIGPIYDVETSPDGTQIAILDTSMTVHRLDLTGTRSATLANWFRDGGWLLPVLAVLWGLAWWINRLYQKRRTYQYAAREQTDETPDLQRVFLDGIQEVLFPTLQLYRIAQRFRRREEVLTRRLAPVATVEATIGAGGIFSPVYATRKIRPEYLVLIDRSAFQDQRAAYVDNLLDQLKSDEIITRYYFDQDPRICFPENPDLLPLSLENLFRTYPDHRLIVFSEAYGMFNPITGALANWTDQFEAWQHKFLFVPEHESYRSYREPLLGEIFVLLPATPEGLAELDQYLDDPTQTEYPFRRTSIGKYPDMLQSRPMRWLERVPPDTAHVEEMLQKVEAYLGRDGYRWLAGCAVYPEMNWKLTVNLAHELKDKEGNTLLNVTTLSALARLPWFRHNYMPDWLRLKLIRTLTRKEESEIRQILFALLQKTLFDPEGRYDLSYALQQPQLLEDLFKIWWYRNVNSKDDEVDTKSNLDDASEDLVFLKFMKDEHRESLFVQIPEAFSRRAVGNREKDDFRRIRIGVAWLLPIIGLLIGALLQIPASYSPPRLIESINPDGSVIKHSYDYLRLITQIVAISVGLFVIFGSLKQLSHWFIKSGRSVKRGSELPTSGTAETDSLTQEATTEEQLKVSDTFSAKVVKKTGQIDDSFDGQKEVEEEQQPVFSENKYTAHKDAVWSVAFHAREDMLISSSEDGLISFWDATTKKSLRKINNKSSALSLVLYPDMQRMATGHEDGGVRFWNLEKGVIIHKVRIHDAPIWSLALSSDGKLLASGSADKTAKILSASFAEPLNRLKAHTQPVWSVAFSHFGSLATGSADKTIRIWDTILGRELFKFEGHDAEVLSVAYSWSGKYVASGSLDGTVRVWDTEKSALVNEYEVYDVSITCVTFCESDNLLAFGGSDGIIRIWNVSQKNSAKKLGQGMGAVNCLAIDGSGHRLLAGYNSGHIRMWNIRSGIEI